MYRGDNTRFEAFQRREDSGVDYEDGGVDYEDSGDGPVPTLCDACCCKAADRSFGVDVWCAGLFAPCCLLGSTHMMQTTKRNKLIRDPCDGCGLPCGIYYALEMCFGCLIPAIYASHLLSDENADSCCEPDKGCCNVYCQYLFCTPCAACKFYEMQVQKTEQQIDRNTRTNAPRSEKMRMPRRQNED